MLSEPVLQKDRLCLYMEIACNLHSDTLYFQTAEITLFATECRSERK